MDQDHIDKAINSIMVYAGQMTDTMSEADREEVYMLVTEKLSRNVKFVPLISPETKGSMSGLLLVVAVVLLVIGAFRYANCDDSVWLLRVACGCSLLSLFLYLYGKRKV